MRSLARSDPSGLPTVPHGSTRLGYAPALDGLRAVAIFGVLADHLDIPYFAGGHVGVSVFFLLSGFLITTLLLEEHDVAGRIDLAAFYARRAGRLLPALVLALVGESILGLALYGRGSFAAIRWGASSAFLYCANIIQIAFPAIQHVQLFAWAWTLSQEEQFYVLWSAALLFGLGSVRGRKVLVVLAVALALGSIGERFALTVHGGWSVLRVYSAPDTRMDAMLIGCLLAFGRHAGRWPFRAVLRERAATPVVLGGGLLILVAYHYGLASIAWTYRYGLLLVDVGTVAIIVGSLSAPSALAVRLLASRPLVRIGQISYGLYLWNLVVRDLVSSLVGSVWWERAPLVLPLLFIVTEASFRLVEVPIIRRVRLHLAHSRSADAPAGVVHALESGSG